MNFVVGEVTSFAAFFVGQALISGHAPRASLGDPGVARAVVGAGLALTALAVLSVAALRQTRPADACQAKRLGCPAREASTPGGGRTGPHRTAPHVHSEMRTNVQSNMRTHVHIKLA